MRCMCVVAFIAPVHMLNTPHVNTLLLYSRSDYVSILLATLQLIVQHKLYRAVW